MTKMTMTDDEIEDIRFCLARTAQANEDLADRGGPAAAQTALREQAGRFRVLARKVSAVVEAAEIEATWGPSVREADEIAKADAEAEARTGELLD